MVKVNGPMFSLAASGTLGKAVTFSHWKGRPYVRERVIPSNPKSGAQVGRRAMFRFLSQNWDALAASSKALWQPAADQAVVSPFNAYVSANMARWHNFLAPGIVPDPAQDSEGSDNELTAATWVQNRIELELAGADLKQTWGIIVFASTDTPVTSAVGNAIIVEPDVTVAAHSIFWTPPAVDTYYFTTRTFSLVGDLEAQGAEEGAPH